MAIAIAIIRDVCLITNVNRKGMGDFHDFCELRMLRQTVGFTLWLARRLRCASICVTHTPVEFDRE